MSCLCGARVSVVTVFVLVCVWGEWGGLMCFSSMRQQRGLVLVMRAWGWGRRCVYCCGEGGGADRMKRLEL